ncbi:iron uptake porin [Leptolyngbya sp. NIES-2104]|uniref:iron uptake porin n=1 Tax=Leptolyngbya sp. NIES-2104 TaxID=1552121 RepID=UPI0006EC790D|nr:iron uptake porin [Leptolyngbya sp. NIES-2104]GAP96349.1 zinc-regulated outer membrane porin [Leptolyngbya sp. NIES-2104]
MPKFLIHSLVLAAGVSIASSATANETPNVADLSKPEPLSQVTSVSQLSDVRPTDWAFQALQSLVERYGCIAGYPDRTYRGNRALTRFEFAAGLNACLDRVNELIAASTADLVKKEDLATLQKLQEQFAAELATIRGRVDALEARTTTLEKQQFSTTTKLNAEVVLGITGAAAGRDFIRREFVPGVGSVEVADRVSRNTIVGNRVRLNFDTSFTGRDNLRTRLQAANLSGLPANLNGDQLTNEGSLRFAGGENNEIGLDALNYTFPIGENTTVVLEANAGAIDDFTDTLNPFLDGDGGSGALSHFGTRNSIYYLGNGTSGTGLGLRHKFGEALELSLGYLSGEPNSPAAGSGLFNGSYGAMAQLTFRPSERLGIGLTYINAYNVDYSGNGAVGSTRANFRSLAETGFLADNVPTIANAYGVSATFQIAPQLVLNGSVGYTNARSLQSGARGTLDIWNWAVGLAVPDFLKKGSVAGVIVGMEPRVTGARGAFGSAVGRDRDTSLHVEGFYQFQLNDNIAITPGIIWLTAPNHDNRNDDIVIGTIRTTFTF